jgi:hypothetical protein
MAAPSDLTTLANVKAWLSGNPAIGGQDDALLGRLITAASRFILATLQRPIILPHAVTESYDGDGSTRMTLAQWPVTSVAALAIDGNTVPASNPAPTASGYLLEAWDGSPPGRPQTLYLVGYGFSNFALGQGFTRAYQNVQVTYTAGYQVTNEAAAVPANPGPYTIAVAAPYGNWCQDAGVRYAAGGALTPVTGAPAAGQYAAAAGVYTFSSADAGRAVLISYGFTPADLEQAAIELVGERYRHKGRIGMASESQGGHVSTAFTQKDMHPFVAALIEPYRRVF